MLPEFELERCETLGDALNFLHEKRARPLAGGTDLLVQLRAGIAQEQKLCYIGGLKELQCIEEQPNGLLIGSGMTFAQLRRSDAVRNRAKALFEASIEVGAPAIRNRATIGGNVQTASPAADGLIALAAYEAHVILQSAAGRRELTMNEFLLGPKKTAKNIDELIVGFRLTAPDAKQVRFFKVGRRNALAISVVNGAVMADIGEGGVIHHVCVTLGAVAPLPVRIDADDFIAGKVYTKEVDEALQSVIEERISPISDVRASKEYRRYIAGVMVRRTLRALAMEKGGANEWSYASN